MNKKDVIDMLETLKKNYPDAKCSLDFETPFELLVAVILSAQCTDDRTRIRNITCFITSYIRLAICNRCSNSSCWINLVILLKKESGE